MGQKVFAKGISVFNPKDNAPEFVLGTIAISVDKLLEWCDGDGAEYMTDYKGNRQIKLSVTTLKDKRGIMVAVDTWRPKENSGERNIDNPTYAKSEEPFNGNSGDQSDLPF